MCWLFVAHRLGSTLCKSLNFPNLEVKKNVQSSVNKHISVSPIVIQGGGPRPVN